VRVSKGIALAAVCAVAVATLIPGGIARADAAKATRPGPPTSLATTAVNTAIAVSWSPPISDGGSIIIRYVAAAAPGAETCTTTSATSCTVSGLINGTKYRVRVRAVNAVGEGRAAQRTMVVPTSARDCAYFGPYANLQDCNLSGAGLSYVDLHNANLSSTDLSGASLEFVSSGDIAGTPSALPTGWRLADGYLLGPEADLSGADLAKADLTGAELQSAQLNGADLSRVDFSGANLFSTNLTGATLVGVTWSDTTCPDGTNSNHDGDTCVNDLTP
jgi:Pentapeptide repeats (8 copies)/Fibronectin type III domain